MTKRLWGVAGLLILATACTQREAEVGERKHILIAGSSTVFPFTEAVAKQFHAKNGQLPMPVVQSTGTGPGIAAFCGGVGAPYPDIVDASRRMRGSELKACAAHGVTGVSELQIGIDGVAFVQSPTAPPVKLSRKQIYAALAATPFGKPQTHKKWREIEPALPDIPILVFGPPPGDGTRDALAELILKPGCRQDPAMAAMEKQDPKKFESICTAVRTDGPYQVTGEDDEKTTVQLIVNPGAIGIFGYSYLEEKGDRLRGIAIDGVAPAAAAIASGKYAGSRPLFIYVKAGRAEAVPGLKAFLAEYAAAIGPGGYLDHRGLVVAPEAVRARTTELASTLAPVDAASLNEGEEAAPATKPASAAR